MEVKPRRIAFISLIVIVFIALLVILYALMIGDGSTRYDLPKCSDLPPITTAEKAITDHEKDLDSIRKIDSRIQITAFQPCKDDPSRGAILFTVPDKDVADQVSQAFGTMPSLGVASTIKIE